MITLKNILTRFNVVVADYDNSGGYSLTLYHGRYKKGEVEFGMPEVNTAELDKLWSSVPLLLYICGYGVISKPAEQVAQLVSDREKFISCAGSNETINFVRRSQVEPLLEKLDNQVLHTECIVDKEDAVTRSREYYRSGFTIKNLLQPDKAGSQLSTQLYKRIRLPLLSAVLIILLVNFFAGESINRKYSENHYLLTALQREKGRQDELSNQEQDMMREFGSGINFGFAYLCDRIGAAVPESIILKNIAVQPPVRRMEEGKPFNVEMSKVVVRGEAMTAAGISLFTSQLKSIDRVRDLKISSVEQNRDGNALGFIIEMEL